MLKLFWDKDNIAFISDQVNAVEHSHCVLQVFLSFDVPLQVVVNGGSISGKCIILNKKVKHEFLCSNIRYLSILIEPSSNFAKEMMNKIDGDYLIFNNNLEHIQHLALSLINTNDKAKYIDFVQNFANYLGINRSTNVLDERIAELLELLRNCDCYDHTIDNFANKVCLSPSRLSHLFREQIGVSLKSYIQFHQLEKALMALISGESISDAAMLAGFGSPSHFASTVKKWMGMPASASMKDSEILKVFI